MKHLFFTLILILGLKSLNSQDLLYKQSYYSFDLGLRGSFIFDRYGLGVANFVTMTSGVEIKEMILAKGFIGLSKDPYLGFEGSFNTTWNIPGYIDVIIGTQVGYYRNTWGLGYPQIQTRFMFSDNMSTSIIVSPDRLELRIGFINAFK